MTTKNILITTGVVVGLFALYNAKQKKATPKVYFRKSLANNYNARTIPPFGIFIKEEHKQNVELLRHELIHWKQYQDKGLIKFYLDYAKELKKYGYDAMPMEQEARVNETDFCKQNYTQCVRNGLSNTIFNPNFRL